MKTFRLGLLLAFTAGSMALATGPALARHGADNPAGDVRHCNGCDDPANHDAIDDRGQDVNDVDVMDDNDVLDLQAQVENQIGDVRRGRGNDDGPGHH